MGRSDGSRITSSAPWLGLSLGLGLALAGATAVAARVPQDGVPRDGVPQDGATPDAVGELRPAPLPDDRAVDPLGRPEVEHWLDRLSDPDLDRREAAFGELVERARREPRALQLLRETASDGTHPEVAWTARLALRELRQGARDPKSPVVLFRHDPFEVLDGRLRARLTPKDADGKSVRISENPGRIVVTVIDGSGEETREKSFEASTRADLLARYPDLAPYLERSLGPAPDAEVGAAWRELELLFGAQGGTPFEDAPFETGPFEGRVREAPRPAPDGTDASDELRTDVLGVYVGLPSRQLLDHHGLERGAGLAVLRIEPNTIAGLLGLAAGDLLLDLNGRAMTEQAMVSEVMGARSPQEEIRVTWLDFRGRRHQRTWVPATVPDVVEDPTEEPAEDAVHEPGRADESGR